MGFVACAKLWVKPMSIRFKPFVVPVTASPPKLPEIGHVSCLAQGNAPPGFLTDGQWCFGIYPGVYDRSHHDHTARVRRLAVAAAVPSAPLAGTGPNHHLAKNTGDLGSYFHRDPAPAKAEHQAPAKSARHHQSYSGFNGCATGRTPM